MSDEPRDVLSVPKKSADDFRREIAKSDVQNLALDPRFLRFLFTVLHTAGMFTLNYQPDARDLGFLEGRRSLGLDILRSAQVALGQDALQRILEAENKTLKEAPSGRSRNSDDRDDGREPGDGLRYLELDYTNQGS